ncbi:IscS subfamily cysteine desulfurase, partial [Oceanobacter sp. 2_MG-2023]|nr:IscS subfamily cysteine desulfurase [Oceanobacter sp. 2_MG-2023]
TVVGLGNACDLAMELMEYENNEVAKVRDRLQAGFLAAVPHSFVTGDHSNRLPNTLNFAFEYIDGESILLLMNKAG